MPGLNEMNKLGNGSAKPSASRDLFSISIESYSLTRPSCFKWFRTQPLEHKASAELVSPVMPGEINQSEPFKATLLWEKIVIHLERTLKTGWHTIGLRCYGNCFHGSKAVDCLMSYLTTILPKPVQRAQVVVLCEKLLQTGVIKSVKEKQEFREKGLFRFTFTHFWSSPQPSTMGNSDSDSSLKTELPKSRSMEFIGPEANHPTLTTSHLKLPIPKGYASDSTVTLSTHRSKRKTKSRRSPVKQSYKDHPSAQDSIMFTSSKSVSKPSKARKDPSPQSQKSFLRFRKYSLGAKNGLPLRETALREKEDLTVDRQDGKRVRKVSKLKEKESSQRNSQDWHHLAELQMSYEVPAILNVRGMNRSHSFSSHGELTHHQPEIPARHSRKWTVYGYI